jgi:chemotaxis protein methyltransferase CheR
MNDQEYSYLKNRISKLTNLDIDSYKSQQMRRRLEGFVAKSGAPNAASYCCLLEKDQHKRRELVDYLAINVSEFFRDEKLFQYLKTVVLPELLGKNFRLNLWSAACSCGQEAYSLAIMLEELCQPDRKYRILATDIDQSAMQTARSGGPYPPSEIKNLDQHVLARYFSQTGEGCFVVEGIRKKVEFRYHDLLRDNYERGFDLIVCRNVFIYFSDTIRACLYQKFHQALKEGGVLFIGGSEVMHRPHDLGFSILCPSFYKKLPVGAGEYLPVRT